MRYLAITAVVLTLCLSCCASKNTSGLLVPNVVVYGADYYEGQGVTTNGSQVFLSDPVYSYAKYRLEAVADDPPIKQIVVHVEDGVCYGAYHNGLKWVWSGPYTEDFSLSPSEHWAVACNACESVTIEYSVVVF